MFVKCTVPIADILSVITEAVADIMNRFPELTDTADRIREISAPQAAHTKQSMLWGSPLPTRTIHFRAIPEREDFTKMLSPLIRKNADSTGSILEPEPEHRQMPQVLIQQPTGMRSRH